MIPKVFHHVWPGGDEFRSEFFAFRHSFMEHHPDWSFRFWRLDLGDAVSEEVRAIAYDPRYSVVVKSDILRYELLRVHGGIYVDTDMQCLRAFDEFLDDGFFCGREDPTYLCPSVIGCVAGHPLITLLAREAVKRLHAVEPEDANARPNQITGPSLLTSLARDRGDIQIYPESHFYPVPCWDRRRLSEPPADSWAVHWWNGAASPDGWAANHSSDAKRYDLGSDVQREGYITVGTNPGSDMRCAITELDRVHPNDNDVDEFLLIHALATVPSARYTQFLEDLFRKLRPGGQVVVVQTDADLVIRDHVEGDLSFRSMRSTLFPPEDRLQKNDTKQHHNMWSVAELARDFERVGYRVRPFDAGSWNLDTADRLHDADIAPDRGKPIANLGLIATRPDQ